MVLQEGMGYEDKSQDKVENKSEIPEDVQMLVKEINVLLQNGVKEPDLETLGRMQVLLNSMEKYIFNALKGQPSEDDTEVKEYLKDVYLNGKTDATTLYEEIYNNILVQATMVAASVEILHFPVEDRGFVDKAPLRMCVPGFEILRAQLLQCKGVVEDTKVIVKRSMTNIIGKTSYYHED